MGKQLFRQSTLDQLQSPDQLDQLLTVTNYKSWIALIGTSILIVAIIIWGFVGNLEENVYGEGILISSGGIQQINSNENGQITDISVAPGDEVESGNVVARLDQPELLNGIRAIEAQIEQIEKTETDLYATELTELTEQLAALQTELQLSTRVVSPYSGKVVEVKANSGDFITKGTPIVSVERTGEQLRDLQAVFYVSPNDGNKIHAGMEVKIEPASISKETYGYLQGRVIDVANFPSTFQGMMNTIGNEDLVAALSGAGAPIEVTVSLIPDQQTESGFKWTSSSGPPVTIQSGALSRGIITVEKSAPIAKIFPQMK